jgi:hypothetical protein
MFLFNFIGPSAAHMTDDDLGKKLVEEEHLLRFLDAYETVTGAALTIQSWGESPDFTCAYESGELVGIELARSPHDYEMRVYDRIWTACSLPSFDLLWSISSMIAVKEHKRRSQDWPSTILVVELLDYRFESLNWTSDNSLGDDFSDTGFREIWLADYSTVEPFGQIRLIGLHPSSVFGLHHQPALAGKPYG